MSSLRSFVGIGASGRGRSSVHPTVTGPSGSISLAAEPERREAAPNGLEPRWRLAARRRSLSLPRLRQPVLTLQSSPGPGRGHHQFEHHETRGVLRQRALHADGATRPCVPSLACSLGSSSELVAILNLAAFDDDVGVRLEQADDLFVGGDRLAMKNATFGSALVGRHAQIYNPLSVRPGGVRVIYRTAKFRAGDGDIITPVWDCLMLRKRIDQSPYGIAG
jgi:hypothetical protein